jgi:hypothetical protein
MDNFPNFQNGNSMKTRTIVSLTTALLALGAAYVWGNDLDKILQKLTEDGPQHYQEPPHYSYSTGYYPYSPPPPEIDIVARRQHAYDVGYRVGQDDFHQHLTLHFVRHPDLYDEGTHDAFARGYTNGYNVARELAVSREREFSRPKVNSQPVRSEHYASGYSPYAPPPKEGSLSVRKQHAFETGFRAGQDDFHQGHSKHFTRHDTLYDADTHDSFAKGYEGGYDAARSRKR